MHDTVSRALNSARNRQTANGSTQSLDVSLSGTEALSVTSEQMTRRLQILNSEYEDKSYTEINVNPSSVTSKEYWCRLREAFSSKASRSKSRRSGSSSGVPQVRNTCDHVLPGPIATTAAGKEVCSYVQALAI